jgi:hypothetical protein
MAEEKGIQLITLTKDTKEFEANGVKYFVESTISRKRWVYYLRESPKLAFGQTVEEIFNTFLEIYNITNEEGFRRGDIAVLARDAMKGIEGIANREDQVIVRLCALFINAEDEDRRDINEDMISRKIADWDARGIDMQSFFQFALAFIPNFKNLYEASLELTSPIRQR